ncbi:MAG: cation:proton antiporter [Clostridia bacterium]|nr:cation:proton antiporter [Clostridia bacterium]
MYSGNSALGFAAVLAIILFSTKLLGLGFRHFGLPQVLGYIIAGLLIGPAIFGDLCGFCLIGFKGAFEEGRYWALLTVPEAASLAEFSADNALGVFSKIGVLLLMFSTGLETNLKELKNTGLVAALVACAGVALPLILGFLIALPFTGTSQTGIYHAVFLGTILTATSVAITVSVLKELGKINSKLGTTIVSAAIIDDVIGIILLSVVKGVVPTEGGENLNAFEAFKSTIYGTLIMIVCFFVFAIVAGFGLSKCFKWIDKRWPEHHRIPVFSLAVCFAYSWIAEEIFGVADITGAFLAGVVLSTDHRASVYTDSKVEVNTYTVFAPVFFANIGISSIKFLGMNPQVLLFAVLAVLVGLIGKVAGCGAVCKAFKYGWKESAIGGVGMMARGEVALIITAAVTSSTLGAYALPADYMIMTVLLILISSVLTPVFLKLLYKEKKGALPLAAETVPPETASANSEQSEQPAPNEAPQTDENPPYNGGN